LRRAKAEGGGEVERNRHHADNHNRRAGKVEVLHQRVDDQPAGQALQGQGMHPADMARNETEDCRRKYKVEKHARHFGDRGSGRARAQPGPPQGAQHQRDHEGGYAFQLQQYVTDGRADQAGPIMGLACGVAADGVQGWVRWMVGDKRKEEEACSHQQHHASHFVQATVTRRCQC
jgi:hypothetical protein